MCLHICISRDRPPRALTCLVHALNNILGAHMIDVDRMKQFARDMFLRQIVHARKRGDRNIDINATRKQFYDPDRGNFSEGVAALFAKMAMGLKLKLVYPLAEHQRMPTEQRLWALSNLIDGSGRSYLVFEHAGSEGHALCIKTKEDAADPGMASMYIVDSLQPAPHVINERDYVHGYRKWTIYEFVRYDAREQEREAENDHIEID